MKEIIMYYIGLFTFGISLYFALVYASKMDYYYKKLQLECAKNIDLKVELPMFLMGAIMVFGINIMESSLQNAWAKEYDKVVTELLRMKKAA